MRKLALLCLAFSLFGFAADDNDLSFSVGLKYWASDFETQRSDGLEAREESGNGGIGGISLGVTKDQFTVALTYLDHIKEYNVFKDDDFQIRTDYEKTDVDLTFTYAMMKSFGFNLGYKMIDTSFVTELYSGDELLSADVSLDGFYGGIYGLLFFDQINSIVSSSVGYGFLSTSDLDFSSGTTYETSSADGPTWELGWNVLLGKFVLSASYKFQDFKYDVTRSEDGSQYEASDLTKGFVLGVRYYF